MYEHLSKRGRGEQTERATVTPVPGTALPEPLRFELTPEQTARYHEWASHLQQAFWKEGIVGPGEITISFRLAGMWGTKITARCGTHELVLQEMEM